MGIYFCCIILTMIAFKLFNYKKALKISFVILAVVAALRKYTVGVDTDQFYRMFTYIGANTSWNYRIARYEPGYFYLCKLLFLLCRDGQILIVVTSLFINYSAYRFIKENSPGYYSSTLLYIFMNIYFSNMNVMRQAVASSILLLGFRCLKEKRYWEYLVYVAIATMFHKVSVAAVLIVVFMVLPDRKLTYILEVFLAVISFVLGKRFFFLLSAVFGHSGYADSEFGVSNYFGSLIAAGEILLVAGLLLFLAFIKKRDAEKLQGDKLFIVICLLYIWFSFLVVRMNIFNRIAELFAVYTVVLFPKLLEYVDARNHRNYKIMCVFVRVVYFTSFVVINYFRPEWYGVVPYQFFWR